MRFAPAYSTMRFLRHRLALLVLLATGSHAFAGEDFRFGQPPQADRPATAYAPDLVALTRPANSELRVLVERFVSDRDALLRFYSVTHSALQTRRLRDFYQAWEQALDRQPYEPLGVEGRLDWHLLRAHLRYELGWLERGEQRSAEVAALLPSTDAIARLQENRRAFLPVVPAEAAATLTQITAALAAVRQKLETPDAAKPSRIVALRALRRLPELTATLKDWFAFSDGYDPQFTWWVATPYQKLTAEIAAHTQFLQEKIVGFKAGENEPIVGDPIGRDGLALDLAHEFMPYTPEQLIVIAEREMAWCVAEWKKVAHDLGLGDDWRDALERTKQDHLAPGQQPAFIARLLYESADFVTRRDLVTVPPHALDTIRMGMLSPAQQKMNPFFLGGEEIQLSFPTSSMNEDEKRGSLRANNQHFCRATVFHELIPGHQLQGWYAARYQPHRELFSTPFYVEGWALWWEFHLWDLGFPQSPENRAGMLFWRTHRCARIIFSLNFHLGQWTPQQCIDYLVDNVGHDRHTATGEVRRSFNGDYSPLYQVGYMMGAIQLRALYADLVTRGKMTEKTFHDQILQGGPMPIELVRARLTATALPRDYRPTWLFADERRR